MYASQMRLPGFTAGAVLPLVTPRDRSTRQTQQSLASGTVTPQANGGGFPPQFGWPKEWGKPPFGEFPKELAKGLARRGGAAAGGEGGAAAGGGGGAAAGGEGGAAAGGGSTILPLVGLAAAVLAAIAAGAATGYLIEEYSVFAPKPPKQGTPTPSCVPVPPNTQHSITSTSHLGCARSEGLARQAAEDDCKTRTARCAGTCSGGRACVPYAHVWNTATITASNVFDALWSGCSTTAYYTCECGC